MITQKDQNDLFMLIAKKLDKDIECIAFGGTAMMFYGYKNVTKDIDLVFNSIEDRKVFISAIEKLGYKEKNKLLSIYSKDKRIDTTAPVMFQLSDERFDLFAETIFRFKISETIFQRVEQFQDFQDKNRLRLNIISSEDLVLLKSLTDRENDFEDIKKIISLADHFDWNLVVDEAKKQPDGWILLDLEKTLLKLKDEFDIPESVFKKLYG